MTAITVDSRPSAAEPPARISMKRTLRHGLTLAWRNVAQLRHSPEKLLDTTLMPIVFLLLFLYVFGGAVAATRIPTCRSCSRGSSRRWRCSPRWGSGRR
ncbi:hypothetical protein ACFQY7_25510 [Actinomadura luteofluorescens]|uniref:hypothetical protein n=1 Tax=Actinomadura luteofluorescens TaxID=46163 RepID=UPI003637B79D